MSNFTELISLELPELARMLSCKCPPRSAILRHEWRLLCGVFFDHISEQGDKGCAFDDAMLRLFSEAEDYLLSSAVSVGAFGDLKWRGELEATSYRIRLCASLLKYRPPSDRFPVISLGYIAGLMIEQFPVSLDEAVSVVRDWKHLSAPEILRLRLTKNLLRPALELAVQYPESALSRVVEPWRDVFQSLP